MRKKDSRNRRRGFSLVELMFVVLIIGILTTIVVSNVTRHVRTTKVQTTKTTMQTIEGALEMFAQENDRYPTNSEGLAVLVESKREGRAGYLKTDEVPKDAWGLEFRYMAPGENRIDYDLASAGPDKSVETEDDITNWKRS